ncbi:hypothetical protein Glove_194g209 [Diversispora epigaea]|uniref:Uncharacterized protein n=1 Tax=Diversispora epigaea TaxID=1348612 RepID=A0A397ILF5_9GLOM|nr:hypothetical protein Glove_194g209 [Diversispora epigaea]
MEGEETIFAIGLYQVEREDNEIEMVLFVSINSNERNSETQAVFEKDGFYSVGAIGLYQVEREDNEIEMVLFVSINSNERNSETQAVFEKDGFYSVGGKIVSGYYGGVK